MDGKNHKDVTKPSGHSARHHRYLETHSDAWRLSPKARLSIGRSSDYWGFGRACATLAGMVLLRQMHPQGVTGLSGEAGQGEEASLIQRGKRRMKMLLCSQQQQRAKPRTFIFAQLQKKKIIPLHHLVLQLSPPFHACPLTGTSADPLLPYHGDARETAETERGMLTGIEKLGPTPQLLQVNTD